MKQLLVALLLLASCGAQETDVVDERPFVALSEGRALDGRTGLELYAHEARGRVLEQQEEKARYWGNMPASLEELEAILAAHDRTTDGGQDALFDDLSAFLQRNMGMTESYSLPGLHELELDGDRATAIRLGGNPGGETRTELRFRLIDGLWYLDEPGP